MSTGEKPTHAGGNMYLPAIGAVGIATGEAREICRCREQDRLTFAFDDNNLARGVRRNDKRC